jgi:hypothetical protein
MAEGKDNEERGERFLKTTVSTLLILFIFIQDFNINCFSYFNGVLITLPPLLHSTPLPIATELPRRLISPFRCI